jgi:glycosyltransferase involved in cell wall biosynthesis
MQPRVLMVISFFYPFKGGAEQQAFRLSQSLMKRGVSVAVLTRSHKAMPPFEKIKGVPVYRSIRTVPWRKWFGLIYIVSVLWFLFRKRDSYDIIHCHDLRSLHTVVALLFKLLGKKVIVKVACSGTDSDFKVFKQSIPGKLLFGKLQKIDRLITICNLSNKEAIQEGFPRSSITYIPNGVDPNLFSPASSSELKENKFCFVGSLVYRKGVHVLLQAFKKLVDKGLRARLDIIGDGPERSSLEKTAHRLGIDRCVVFHGEQQNIVGFLREASVFVLPSYAEGLPNVLLEAMACALPVVATRVGGNVDIIEDGQNGMLVDCNDPEQLSRALQAVSEDRDRAKKLGAAARKTIESRFSIEQVADQYCNLYKELAHY